MQRIMSFIDIGKKEGATLEYGGNRWGNEGYFIEPTVFTDVNSDMTIVKEEIFGPGELFKFYLTILSMADQSTHASSRRRRQV